MTVYTFRWTRWGQYNTYKVQAENRSDAFAAANHNLHVDNCAEGFYGWMSTNNNTEFVATYGCWD
jgi:hypothetical protein